MSRARKKKEEMNGNAFGVLSPGALAGAERSEGERSEPQRAAATQSRVRKRKSVWQIEFDGTPLWLQQKSSWSLPVGTPLYIRRKAKIGNRQRVLFQAKSPIRPLMVWGERVVGKTDSE